MLPVYKNSGVKSRFLVNNLNWYGNLHSWEERNYLFKKNSLLLLKKCVRKVNVILRLTIWLMETLS